MQNLKDEMARYAEACNYPGAIDDEIVEKHLRRYLTCLGEKRSVVRLREDWTLDANPALGRYVEEVLKETAARDARDARAARAARAARDAIRRFTIWCIMRGSWYWYSEISYLSATYLGSLEKSGCAFIPWSKEIFEAFCSGCWIIHWTKDTLYWVAKPRVSVDQNRRLHRENGAALECDLENLYFWRGVMVPERIIVSPESMTPKEIMTEQNAQVRMVMIERYGFDRFMLDAGAKTLDTVGEYRLVSVQDQEWGQIKALKMVCPSTSAVFVIPVDPKHEKVSTALDEMKGVNGYLERIRLQT